MASFNLVFFFFANNRFVAQFITKTAVFPDKLAMSFSMTSLFVEITIKWQLSYQPIIYVLNLVLEYISFEDKIVRISAYPIT